MKCSCDAERSFSAEARHFVMKACGVTASKGTDTIRAEIHCKDSA